MPITINPSPTPKKPLTTAEKLARLRASEGKGSSVPKSSIPKAPLSGKTINNTLPESPTRKFWEDDSFKQYVHKLKTNLPSSTPTASSMPDRIMKNVDMEAQASASAIRGKMSQINAMLNKYPRNDVGQIPRLDPDIPVGGRLYFDINRGEITSRETDLPFFLDQNRNLTLDSTQANNAANPAFFNSKIAKGMLEDYSTFLTTYADAVNTPPIEYKKMSVGSLERDMTSGKVSEGMVNVPVYADGTVGGEAEPQVVSVTTPQMGIVRAFAETGNAARDVIARSIMVGKGTSWIPDASKELELSRMGMMGVDKQTANIIQAAGISIQKSDPILTKVTAFAGNTAAYAIGFIMKGLRAILPEVGMKERARGAAFKNMLMATPVGSTAKAALSGYEEVMQAVDEQYEESQKTPDQFAFKDWQESWDYLTAYTKATGEIIATTPEAQKNLLLSDYNKKLAVVDIGNAVITDYDFANPEQLGNAITKLVEAHDLESTIGARDINATWTGMGDPARDKQFKYLLAQFEINKYVTTGELWATKEEREQLKSYVADPSIEFAGQMLFDFNNLLNIPSSTVFSDDFLRNYARATGVRNVNELQLDGLMFTTAARYAGKGINFLGAGAMEGVNLVKGSMEGLGILKPIDNQMLDLAQRNLNFSSKAKISNRTLASKIFNNTTDLFNNYAGSATSIIKEVPETMFSEITNMGLDIAAIKAEGITDINEIVRRIQASDKYSPLISSDKRIIDINRMVDQQNPLGKGKGQGAWKLENSFGEARTAKAEEYKIFFDKKIHDGTIDLNDFTKDTGIPEVNDILRRAIDVEPDKQMSFIGKELSNLANKFGNERLTMDEVAQTIGAKFSRKFKDEHSVFSAGKTNFMDDQLRGIIDKWLTKKGSKLVDGKVVRDATKRGWLVLRDVFRIGHVTKDFIMEQWIGNIITKKPAYWAIQQPLEQGATHLFSGSGSLVRRAVDYVTGTPKLLNALEEFPVPSEATRGFVASMDISKDIDAVKYRDRLVKFYRDNPDSWKPTPGTFSLYFSKSLRDSYDKWVKDAFVTRGVDDLVEQEKLLAQAAKDNRIKGSIPTPDGKKITTVFGKPFSIKERAGSLWRAGLETGGNIASSNELITKAGIAVEHYQTTRQFMNDPQFDILSTQARGILANAGYAPEAIDTAIGNIKRLWNNSHGNASRFVNDLKIKATGKVDVAVGQIPPELQSLSMGMDATEKRLWLEQTNDSLNKYVTGLKVKGEELTPESADVFFKETLDVYKQEAEQVSNIAGGVAGHNIFGESLVKRPISADTQKLLDDIDLGKVPIKLTQNIKKVFVEDNGLSLIDTNGVQKTITQLIDELNESVRPVSWKSPEVHEAEAIAAINESIPRLSTYKPRVDGDYISKYWDTEGRVPSADELLKNPRQIPGEPNIRGMRRDETIARRLEKNPDDPMAEPLEYYKRANGEVRGIVRNLNDKFIASGKTDTAAYDLYNNLNTQVDNENMFQRVLWNDTDGILTTGYPGFKATGEGAHELYKEANLIKGISLSKRGKYFDELKTSVIDNKPDFKQWTVGDPFKAEGIDIVPDVDGFTPLEFTLQRHNGLGVQRFGKGTPFYDMMVNATDAGIKNMEVWNAPLSSSVSELREKALLSQPPKAALLPIEQIPAARIGFMEAFLQKPAFEGDNLWKYIEPFMEGKKLGAIDADDVYDALIKASKVNIGNNAKNLKDFAEWIKEVDHYAVHGVLLNDETVAIPFTSDTVSDKIRAATKIKLTSASQLQGMDNAFKLWKESLLKQSADGSLFLKQFEVTNGDALNEAARVFAKGAVDFEDKLWHGGEIDGIRMEGAVPYAKQRMRVGNESVYDQFAKGIVPFWNFSTRGAATWARFTIEHPQLFRLYQKYLKLGRGQALTTGLTKSNGQPLPSTMGKIRLRRIPGLDIWISPSSMVSPFLFYAFPPKAISKYDEENPELNFWQRGLTGVVSMLRTRGMRVSPLIDIALSAAGLQDPYTTQNPAQKALSFGLGALVPADLIPPWIWNAIDAGVVGKFNKYASSNKTSRPQVEWFDYLVEIKIMEDYLGKIRNASSEDAKVMLAIQERNIIQAREKSPVYQKYVEEIRNTQYYKSVIGYATASYLSWYTEGSTEMYALNKQLNLLQYSTNNELPAAIFFPNKTPEDIEQMYTDLRWTSGEGKLWNVRNTVSHVVDDDTGMPLNMDARRDSISRDFTIETQTEELYAGIGAINEFYDKQRRELDLGRDYSDPVYKNLRLAQSKAILDLQANYPDVDEQWNFWYVGYKPQTKIEEKFTKNIVYLLNSLQPVWDREGGEKYPDYLIRKKAWEDNIPNTVQELAPVFMLQLTSEPNTAWANQDVLGVINDIIPNINIDVVNKVNMSSDSAPEALARAYDALHMDFYYDEVFGKQWADEEQAIREFRKKHPTPTDAQLIGWVKQYYGETWTDKELKAALTRPTGEERTILNAEDAVLRGKSDDEVLRGEVYNIYGTIPSSRKSEFYDTFQLLGGNTDDLTTFFNTGIANPFKVGEEQKLSDLRDAMAMTASKMKIQPPSDEELALQVQAQRLNDELKKMLTMELGEGYEKVVQERGRLDSVALKRKWDNENPVEKKIVNDYYDLRDTFAKKNPIWAYYYTTNTLSHPPTATSDGRKTTAEKLAELRAKGE